MAAAAYAFAMPKLLVRLALLLGMIFSALSSAPLRAATSAPPSALKVEGLGKDTASLSGPWQFHLGDNAAWAQPAADDATGVAGSEQLTADKTWGAQGHPAYVGYAWDRKHVQLEAAPGIAPVFAPA